MLNKGKTQAFNFFCGRIYYPVSVNFHVIIGICMYLGWRGLILIMYTFLSQGNMGFPGPPGIKGSRVRRLYLFTNI